MVINVENFALEQLKRMYNECLYLLSNAYACKLMQCKSEDSLLIDWKEENNRKAWAEIQRLECGFNECKEPIDITRGKYVALFEGQWDKRLYDDIKKNLKGLTKDEKIEAISKLISTFDDCKMPLKGFYDWVNGLECGYDIEDTYALRMWERLNYCIGQFKANVIAIGKKQGINIKLRIVINVLKSVNAPVCSFFIGTFARKFSCY